MKGSAIMNESLSLQYSRTTTRIQSGWDAFDESSFVMTFLTIMQVTEILCNFRFVLDGKTGKEIPKSSRVIRKVFSKQSFVQ